MQELDPKLARMLLETFEAELAEQLQTITDGLLKLEGGLGEDDRLRALQDMFRSAHNIKGGARGVGVKSVADMSHRLESLLSALKQDNRPPGREVIDLCLECLDCINRAMKAFLRGEQPDFDVQALCGRLDEAARGNIAPDTKAAAAPEPPSGGPATGSEEPAGAVHLPTPAGSVEQGLRGTGGDVIRISANRLNMVDSGAEDLQVINVALADQCANARLLHSHAASLASIWTRVLSALKRRGLDELPDEVGKLVAEGTETLAGLTGMSQAMQKGLLATGNRFDLLSRSLRSDIRLLRLMPAATILRPLERVVRDISRELGKKVELRIIGDDIEVDRAVLERLRDPLMHLVRNAIDHGIEDPATRRAQGKEETGHLTVRVEGEGAEILLFVEDDGRGIRSEDVAEAAVRRHMVGRGEVEQMGREDILDLLFHPGFSTRETVTDVSGRGVGLDVVRTGLNGVGGKVLIQSAEGRGTTFVLRMPLTLALDRGVTVWAAGEEFVIPTASVERIMHLRRTDVIEVEASQAVRVENRTVPLRGLADALALAHGKGAEKDMLFVVVLSRGRRSVAFVVDDIGSEREIVIKPLRPPLVSLRNVRGGTLVGSGRVVMVLDGNDLVDTALHKSSRSRVVERGAPEAEKVRRHILVVDDSITSRTLEKNILEAHGFRVTTAVNGQSAWEILQEKRFDLVLTDVEMPEVDGFTLTDRIKQSQKHLATPVVIVSSRDSEDDRRRGLETGADAYIVKGDFETQVLLDTVHQLLG